MKFCPFLYKVIKGGSQEKKVSLWIFIQKEIGRRILSEKDLEVNAVPTLLPKFHLRRIALEINCLLADITVVFKCKDKSTFKKIITFYIRIWFSGLVTIGKDEQRNDRKVPKEGNEDCSRRCYRERLEALNLSTKEGRKIIGDQITSLRIFKHFHDVDID